MDKPNVTKFCDELKFNRFHWNLLILGVLTLVFDGYDSQILAYVMPNVIKEWHLSPVVAGSVVSWGLVGLMIGTAGMGMLADRIGRKIPLILGLVIFCVFNGGLYWVHSFKVFCVLRFLAGLGMGGALTLNITFASEFAPAKLRARMVTTMFTGFMIGPALAGIISILFIPAYGWRVVLFFALLPLIFIPFLCATTCPNRSVSLPGRGAMTRPGRSCEGWKRRLTSLLKNGPTTPLSFPSLRRRRA